jgi:hypothetical protein
MAKKIKLTPKELLGFVIDEIMAKIELSEFAPIEELIRGISVKKLFFQIGNQRKSKS